MPTLLRRPSLAATPKTAPSWSSSLLLLVLLLSAASATSRWKEVSPGGDTICADGTPFRFFYSEGTSNDIVFEFEGGGCCFDALTCASPIYKRYVISDFEKLYLDYRGGIGSFEDSRNPVQNYSRIFIPFCTGDAHLGNNTASYGTHHKGLVNAWAALNYGFDRVSAPERVLVTGISAGAVATYVLAPWIFGHYPGARQVHLADSYAPLFGEKGYNDGLKNWKMADAYDAADISPPLDLGAWRPLSAAANTNTTSLAFPKATFASYVSAEDSVEESFYVAEGGGVDGYTWTKAMREALDSIHAPNFARFVAKGSQHGVLDSSSLHTKSSFVAGTKTKVVLGDWLRDLLDGKEVPMAVDCLGQGC